MTPCVREVAQPLTGQRCAEGIGVLSEPKTSEKKPEWQVVVGRAGKNNCAERNFLGARPLLLCANGFLRWTESRILTRRNGTVNKLEFVHGKVFLVDQNSF
eukprot:2900990-Amphidinium_carterae.2